MRLSLSLLGVTVALGSVSAADLKFAAVFGDHMVLQRGKPVPVWGWANPGETVTVAFAGQSKSATANDSGRWQAKLDPLKAADKPAELTVSGENTRTAKVADVLVGDVWLGSGQSNMAMTVNRCKDFDAEKAAATHPLIRHFREESGASATARPDAKGTWQVCTPDTVGGFSATLYFFGRELQKEVKVPIGLINSSVGGTPIESWVDAGVQAKVPELAKLVAAEKQAFDKFDPVKAKANYAKAVERWTAQAEAAKAAGKTPPRKPVDPAVARTRRGGPGGLFDGKIAPLVPFALKGVLWYQGEANANPVKGSLYHHYLTALVTDWRGRWGEELPFAWVQLPNFNRPGDGWQLVRESMLKTLALPKTGMAITTDIGDPTDIHPKNKQDVGKRLAMWALGTVYGKTGQPVSGPLPAGHEVRGATIVVRFTHVGEGLLAKGELRGFELAGADKVWHPATAKIDGKTVAVASDAVAKPVAVRYSWAANPTGNLVNSAGLPASPFRTDTWVTPEPKK